MKDRYRHWYEVSPHNPRIAEAARILRPPGVRDLEDLVLHDLAKAETESEKLEILDSYSLASQRQYRCSIYETVLDIGQRTLVHLLGPLLEVKLPAPQPPYHRTMVVPKAEGPY